MTVITTEGKDAKEEGGGEGDREAEMEKGEGDGGNQVRMPALSRKQKRKVMKKLKRKQIRKEIAEKEREEEEARLNDPEEQERLKALEEEEARRRERELKEFEEREKAWFHAMELKKKAEEKEREEEEKRQKDLEESKRQLDENQKELEEDSEWEYVEEGPPEIIFQGNEIILKKKKVRIPKKEGKQLGGKEDADRPTSNPLPPQTEVFADYQNSASVQEMLENVAQQVPNFGTEQDKAHCPFHMKTGVCRFGHRCSRVHFYPDKSCTLLIKNMYNGPGLALEQDEGLEYTDEEVDGYYEEFYEDVHTEFLKFGEIVNFKVCRNGSFHLRGNVYVHYKNLESALLAYQSINGRYFAGKQVKCEFVNITRWKVAICGEYMKSKFKTCSHGTACNFIHCFRNPGGDYEWADWDKPPPRYWVKRMAALFGYSDERVRQMELENVTMLKETSKRTDSHSGSHSVMDHHVRQRLRRYESRDDRMNNAPGSPIPSRKIQETARWQRHNRFEDDRRAESRNHSSHSDEVRSDKDTKRVRKYRKTSDHKSNWSKHSLDHEDTDTDDFSSDSYACRKEKSSRCHGPRDEEDDKDRKTHRGHGWRDSRWPGSRGSPDYGDCRKRKHNTDSIRDWSDADDEDTHRQKRNGSMRNHKFSESPGDHRNSNENHDHDSNGEHSDGDADENKHGWHRRRSTRHHGEDLILQPDAHEKSKKRNRDTGRSEGRSHRNKDKSRRHRHKRNSSERHHMTCTPDNDSNTRYSTRDTAVDYHGLESEGEQHKRRRKRPRNATDALDVANDERKSNSPGSSMCADEADLCDKSSNLNEILEGRSRFRHRARHKSHDEDDGITYKPEEDDRWRPESSE